MRFVNVRGILQKARRYVSYGGSVQEDEVKDPRKLAEVIRHLQKRVADVEVRTPPEGLEFEVDLGADGEQVRLAHNLKGPVRYYVTHWKQSELSTPTDYRKPAISITQRAVGLGTWSTSVQNQTNGCRYLTNRARDIVGVRFGWLTNGIAYTVRAKLWLDSSGLALASKDVSVFQTGIYDAYFDAPVSMAAAALFTVSIREITGVRASSYTSDVTWKTSVIELGDDQQLRHHSLAAVGDARPTTVHGAAVSIVCEPIYAPDADVPGGDGPELSADSASDANNLILNSYVAGRAVIRIEPSQAGLS